MLWEHQSWTVPMSGGVISVRQLPQQFSKVKAKAFVQRRKRVVQRFQDLLVQGSGMNMRALKFIGRELRGFGVTR